MTHVSDVYYKQNIFRKKKQFLRILRKSNKPHQTQYLYTKEKPIILFRLSSTSNSATEDYVQVHAAYCKLCRLQIFSWGTLCIVTQPLYQPLPLLSRVGILCRYITECAVITL